MVISLRRKIYSYKAIKYVMTNTGRVGAYLKSSGFMLVFVLFFCRRKTDDYEELRQIAGSAGIVSCQVV
jgi:hypothetical protein